MKKYLLLFAVGLLLSGCAVTSNIQQYRFANDAELHTFNVVQNPLSTSWTLYIDGKEILSGGFPMFNYETSIPGQWNGKNVVMELYYNPGFLGFGRYVKSMVTVNGEKVAEFKF